MKLHKHGAQPILRRGQAVQQCVFLRRTEGQHVRSELPLMESTSLPFPFLRRRRSSQRGSSRAAALKPPGCLCDYDSLSAALSLSQACQTNPRAPSFNARNHGNRKSSEICFFCLSFPRCLVTRRPWSDTRRPHSSGQGCSFLSCFLSKRVWRGSGLRLTTFDKITSKPSGSQGH